MDEESHVVLKAEKELMRKNDFDYLVMNENFEQALEKLKSIFSEILGK